MPSMVFDGAPGTRDRDLKELAEAVASMEPRLDGIETLLKSVVTILQRRNRISLRVSDNQIQQFLKQVSAEMEKLQANHHA